MAGTRDVQREALDLLARTDLHLNANDIKRVAASCCAHACKATETHQCDKL